MSAPILNAGPANDTGTGYRVRVGELPPGVYQDIPAADYHTRELGVASNTAIGQLREPNCPALYHAWATGLVSDEDTAAFAFGRAFHCAVLEPDVFRSLYIEQPDFGDCRYKEAKARRDDWRKEHARKQWLSPEDWQRIEGMRRSLAKHPFASRILRAKGSAELTLRWDDKDTAIACKARLDWHAPALGVVADLKSCEKAGPSAFRRAVADYGYHRQHALYRAACAALDVPAEHFVFVCVEKDPPHLVAVYQLRTDAEAVGHGQNREALWTLAGCLRSGKWPGYDDGQTIQEIDLPTWAAK